MDKQKRKYSDAFEVERSVNNLSNFNMAKSTMSMKDDLRSENNISKYF